MCNHKKHDKKKFSNEIDEEGLLLWAKRRDPLKQRVQILDMLARSVYAAWLPVLATNEIEYCMSRLHERYTVPELHDIGSLFDESIVVPRQRKSNLTIDELWYRTERLLAQAYREHSAYGSRRVSFVKQSWPRQLMTSISVRNSIENLQSISRDVRDVILSAMSFPVDVTKPHPERHIRSVAVCAS